METAVAAITSVVTTKQTNINNVDLVMAQAAEKLAS